MKPTLKQKIDELLGDYRGTKLSLFCPAGKSEMFQRLRGSGLRLLEESGEQDLALRFRKFSSGVPEKELEGTGTLVILFSANRQEVFRLPQDVPSRIVVSQSWHLKPLIYSYGEGPSGFVVDFAETGVRVFASDGQTLSLIQKYEAPRKDQASRKVFTDFIGRIVPPGDLVWLSGDLFTEALDVGYWQKFWKTIIVRPGGLDPDLFRGELLEQRDLRTSRELIADLGTRPTLTGPVDILRGIQEGTVSRVYISLEAIRWGEVDGQELRLVQNGVQRNNIDEDILDDIAELALRRGITVKVLRQDEFPGNHEIIAC